MQQVFYNPIQQFNRDLTVPAIKAYGKEPLEKKEGAQARLGKSKMEKRKRKREQQDK